MDKVTQSNAASAEESAAAAEELSSQAVSLSEMVRELINLVGTAASPAEHPAGSTLSHHKRPAPPIATKTNRSSKPAPSQVMPLDDHEATAKEGAFKEFSHT